MLRRKWILFVAVAAVCAAGIEARGQVAFDLCPNGEFTVKVGGVRLADRFGLRLMRPGWKGTYDSLITGHADPAGFTATIGDYGKYQVTVRKESATKLAIEYRLDLVRKLSLDAAYVSVFIPMEFAPQGGWFASPAGYKIPFPQPIQKKPFFSATVNFLTWTDGLGRGVRLAFDSPTTVSLTDPRRWGKTYFEAMIRLGAITNPGTTRFAITLESTPSDNRVRPFVDRFGQCAVRDWPGKVRSEKDLTADAATEQNEPAATQPARWDPYGGLEGTREKYKLSATGFFRTAKVNNRWHLVDPKGNVFFSLGTFLSYLDSYTDPKGREYLFEWIPPRDGAFRRVWERLGPAECVSFYKANLMRKYGRDWGRRWYENSVTRWNRWGFNTTSAFGGRLHGLAYTGGPFTFIDNCARGIPGTAPDVFDPALPTKLDALCKVQCTRLKEDRLFLGYFFGNEQPFEKIAQIAPGLDGSYAIKRRLVGFLKDRYKGIAEFSKGWGLNAPDFESLVGRKFVARTDQARSDMDAFLGVYCETYGKLLRDTVRRYDPNHLLLGFRWMPKTALNATITRHLGKYMDVVSVNYYVRTPEKFDAVFLAEVSARAGDKPVLLSEFSYGTSERGHTGGVHNADNQTQRGEFYTKYLRAAAKASSVVGAHWYEYVDQAISGRYFGGPKAERCNCGLVDITDRPFEEFVEAVQKANRSIYEPVAN